MFRMKVLLILQRFHEKTISHSGDIKTFRPGMRMYTCTLSPVVLKEVLSEERQLMK